MRAQAPHYLPKAYASLLGPPGRTLTNATVWLFVVCLSIFWGTVGAYALGVLSARVAGLINFLVLYAIYTVTHEAVHHLAHPNRLVNNWMGRIAAGMEGMTFPLFRIIHLQHHAFTNNPERDPDYVIGRKPRWLLPVWTVVRLTHDNMFMYRRGLWANKRGLLTEHLFTISLQITILLLSAYFGHLRDVLFLWIFPLIAAGACIELTVAWLVHFPHESEHPLENTRLLNGRLWQFLMLNQSYHLVHHLCARIPWFRYGKVLGKAQIALARHREEVSKSNGL